MNNGLLFANYACAYKKSLFLRTVFEILFQIFQLNGKKEIQKQISQRLNPFSDFAFDYKSEIRILNFQSNGPFVSQNNENTAILVYQTIPLEMLHMKSARLFWGSPLRKFGGAFASNQGTANCHNKEYLFTHSSAQICI